MGGVIRKSTMPAYLFDSSGGGDKVWHDTRFKTYTKTTNLVSLHLVYQPKTNNKKETQTNSHMVYILLCIYVS